MPVGACLPVEYPQGLVPTLWNEPPELPSGAGPFDAAATTVRLSDATAFPPYTSELEPEDTPTCTAWTPGTVSGCERDCPRLAPAAAWDVLTVDLLPVGLSPPGKG